MSDPTADYIIHGSTLKSIADAIRDKNDIDDDIAVSDMASLISSISSSGVAVPDGYTQCKIGALNFQSDTTGTITIDNPFGSDLKVFLMWKKEPNISDNYINLVSSQYFPNSETYSGIILIKTSNVSGKVYTSSSLITIKGETNIFSGEYVWMAFA